MVFIISIFGIIHLIGGNDGNVYIYNNFSKIIFRSDILCHNDFYYFLLNIILIVMDLFFLIPETLLLILHLHICISNYRENKSRISLLETQNNDASDSKDSALINEDNKSYDSSA